MRIAVMSPHKGNTGNSTLAMLIAFEMAKHGQSTCITHTSSISSCFYEYLNFTGYDDKTSTPTQIVKILKTSELSPDDISDYCRPITDVLEAFTNSATNFKKEDMEFMLDYIGHRFPHEHVVYDVDTDDIDGIRRIVGLSDIVVLNITQSLNELKSFKENREVYGEVLGKIPTLTVINKYNSVKCSDKDITKAMGVKLNNYAYLHENPYIAWATNKGKLVEIYKNIDKKNERVLELNTDLKRIYDLLIKMYKSCSNKVTRRN